MSLITDLKKQNWDFKRVDTKRMTHGIHKYPARMVPQISTELIKTFSSKGDIVLDPFVGSGTVITEAFILGRKAIGNDLNPLARLIASVRTTPIRKLGDIKGVLEAEFKKYDGRRKVVLNDNLLEANINYWFKGAIIKQLDHIAKSINNDNFSKKEKNFLNVCFSMCIRKSSNLREGEYKTYRKAEADLQKHNPDPFGIYLEIFDDYSTKLNVLSEHIKEGQIKREIAISAEDARNMSLKDNSVDFILTSPPYGDSRTTVAYGQFSRYPLLWFGLGKGEVFNLDEILLGGKKLVRKPAEFTSKRLETTLTKIRKYDEKRAQDTEDFISDLFLSIKEMVRVLKKNKHSCIVIGNRTVRTIRVPTDQIIVDMCEKLNVKHVTTFHRNIPSKNNPGRSKFVIDGKIRWIDTMSKESIVVLQKT